MRRIPKGTHIAKLLKKAATHNRLKEESKRTGVRMGELWKREQAQAKGRRQRLQAANEEVMAASQA